MTDVMDREVVEMLRLTPEPAVWPSLDQPLRGARRSFRRFALNGAARVAPLTTSSLFFSNSQRPFCLLQMASTWSPSKLKRYGMPRVDLLAVVRAHVSEAVADRLPEWVNADVLTTAKRVEMWDDIRGALPGIDSASFVKLKLLGNREALKHEDEREEATVGRLLQRIPQAAQSTPQQPTTSGATLVGTKQARERGRAGRPRGPETPAARRCTTVKVFPTLCSPLHRRDYMAGVVIEDSEDFFYGLENTIAPHETLTIKEIDTESQIIKLAYEHGSTLTRLETLDAGVALVVFDHGSPLLNGSPPLPIVASATALVACDVGKQPSLMQYLPKPATDAMEDGAKFSGPSFVQPFEAPWTVECDVKDFKLEVCAIRANTTLSTHTLEMRAVEIGEHMGRSAVFSDIHLDEFFKLSSEIDRTTESDRVNHNRQLAQFPPLPEGIAPKLMDAGLPTEDAAVGASTDGAPSSTSPGPTSAVKPTASHKAALFIIPETTNGADKARISAMMTAIAQTGFKTHVGCLMFPDEVRSIPTLCNHRFCDHSFNYSRSPATRMMTPTAAAMRARAHLVQLQR